MWLDQCEQVSEDYKVLKDKDLLFFQYIYSSYIAQRKQQTLINETGISSVNNMELKVASGQDHLPTSRITVGIIYFSLIDLY